MAANPWGQYPWSTSAASTIDYTMTNDYDYVTAYGHSGWWGQNPMVVRYDVSTTPEVEMPESPMEWLMRRVTEITDLAYVGL